MSRVSYLNPWARQYFSSTAKVRTSLSLSYVKILILDIDNVYDILPTFWFFCGLTLRFLYGYLLFFLLDLKKKIGKRDI